jgi:mono/diheme cytochrome c family protein
MRASSRIIVTLTLFSSVFFSLDGFSQKKIMWTFPSGLVKADQKGFIKEFKEGHELYKMNCAKCHSKDIDGVSIVPNFSIPQLMDYELRFSYPDHQDPMREVLISKEELDKVLLFLQNKVPNEHGVTK